MVFITKLTNQRTQNDVVCRVRRRMNTTTDGYMTEVKTRSELED